MKLVFLISGVCFVLTVAVEIASFLLLYNAIAHWLAAWMMQAVIAVIGVIQTGSMLMRYAGNRPNETELSDEPKARSLQ